MKKRLFFIMLLSALSLGATIAQSTTALQKSGLSDKQKADVAKTLADKQNADSIKKAAAQVESAKAAAAQALMPTVTAIAPGAAEEFFSRKNAHLRPLDVYPGNTVCFTVSNPITFLRSRPNDQASVVVYVNGIELKGICAPWYKSYTNAMLNAGKKPDFGSVATIAILFKRNDTTQQAWDFLYANNPNFFTNHMLINASIGWEGMSQLDKTNTAPELNIVFYHGWIFWCYLLLFIALIGGFVYLAGWTNTLRESDEKSAYSLSVTQLLFWTTLAISAFIYTLVLTDLPSAMNPSILLMLGISLSTTGAATLIDSRFKQQNPTVIKPTSNNFFKDMLTSDGSSYSVQRIQVFAWNLVLGLYFIIYTVVTKTMPVFTSTLLFLAGISSLTYVGTKVPENSNMATTGTVTTEPSNAPQAVQPVNAAGMTTKLNLNPPVAVG